MTGLVFLVCQTTLKLKKVSWYLLWWNLQSDCHTLNKRERERLGEEGVLLEREREKCLKLWGCEKSTRYLKLHFLMMLFDWPFASVKFSFSNLFKFLDYCTLWCLDVIYILYTPCVLIFDSNKTYYLSKKKKKKKSQVIYIWKQICIHNPAKWQRLPPTNFNRPKFDRQWITEYYIWPSSILHPCMKEYFSRERERESSNSLR